MTKNQILTLNMDIGDQKFIKIHRLDSWFKCTDLETKPKDKANYKKELIKYCSKDTEAMYDLINFFLNLK